MISLCCCDNGPPGRRAGKVVTASVMLFGHCEFGVPFDQDPRIRPPDFFTRFYKKATSEERSTGPGCPAAAIFRENTNYGNPFLREYEIESSREGGPCVGCGADASGVVETYQPTRYEQNLECFDGRRTIRSTTLSEQFTPADLAADFVKGWNLESQPWNSLVSAVYGKNGWQVSPPAILPPPRIVWGSGYRGASVDPYSRDSIPLPYRYYFEIGIQAGSVMLFDSENPNQCLISNTLDLATGAFSERVVGSVDLRTPRRFDPPDGGVWDSKSIGTQRHGLGICP